MNKDEFTKSVTSKLDQLAKEQHHNKMLVMNHVLDTVQNISIMRKSCRARPPSRPRHQNCRASVLCST